MTLLHAKLKRQYSSRHRWRRVSRRPACAVRHGLSNNGNTTTDDLGRTQTYDAWNRLVTVKSGTVTLTSYAYDGQNWRIQQTTSGTTTDAYFTRSWQVAEQRVGVSYGNAGTVSAEYVWSAVYVNALVLRDRDTDANGTLDERLYAAQDANDNVTSIISSGGTVQEHFVYDSYGKYTVDNSSWSATSDSKVWNITFQGGMQDQVTGNINFQMRDYNPRTMTWNTQDPLGYVDTANLYQIEMGNTINNVDWMGLASFDPNYLSDTTADGLWWDGIASEDSAGNKMSATFMKQYVAVGPARPNSYNYRTGDGWGFAEEVAGDSQGQAAVKDLVAKTLAAKNINPSHFGFAVSDDGDSVQYLLPGGPIVATGAFAFTKNTDLSHALHAVDLKIAFGSIEFTRFRNSVQWNIDVQVTISDRYDFVLGGAGPGAPAKLALANDLGASMGLRGMARSFAVSFAYDEDIGGEIGCSPKSNEAFA